MKRLLLPLPLVLLAACSSSPVAFRDGGSASCLQHQSASPDASYTREGADVARTLDVLKYYTAHAGQEFCDGHAASNKDLAWMRLYVAKGADAANVSRWLTRP